MNLLRGREQADDSRRQPRANSYLWLTAISWRSHMHMNSLSLHTNSPIIARGRESRFLRHVIIWAFLGPILLRCLNKNMPRSFWMNRNGDFVTGSGSSRQPGLFCWLLRSFLMALTVNQQAQGQDRQRTCVVEVCLQKLFQCSQPLVKHRARQVAQGRSLGPVGRRSQICLEHTEKFDPVPGIQSEDSGKLFLRKTLQGRLMPKLVGEQSQWVFRRMNEFITAIQP